MRMLKPTESPAAIWDIPCCPISHEPLQDTVVLDCVCKGTLCHTSIQSESNFGSSITVSSDGNRIAIGALRQSHTSPATVIIHEWSGNGWLQRGADLVGISPNHWFGYSIALSSDGYRIALSTLIGCSNIAGRVRVYDW